MFTISLHNVKIFAPAGLYAQELVLGNHFEVDIDVYSNISDYADGRFVDYTVLNTLIRSAFLTDLHTLEGLAQTIHKAAFAAFPFVLKIKVSVRKKHPPMPGEMDFAQVVFEA